MKVFAVVPCFILALLVGASFSDAGSRIVSVPLQEVICRIDGRAALSTAGVASKNVTRVKDRRHASECGPSFRATLDCCDVVDFKGFGDCDSPVAASKETTDCGTVKVTNIEFRSGKRVQLRKKNGKVEVDYDRHNRE